VAGPQPPEETAVNPYLTFALLRIGFFVLPLGVLTLLKVPTVWALVSAAVLSLVLSTVFLRDQRRRIAERVAQQANARATRRR
jgi:membrane protein implicated in regulation of membrane protease activity